VWWAAALVAYFCWFSWDALKVKFAPDDLMNLDHYWRHSGRDLALQFVAPWNGGYRPMGGVFYLPLLHFFGLDPAPYHAAMLLVLLGNVFLVYRLARALGCPETAAILASMLACYHAGLSMLYFNTSFVYDALCGFFYLAALAYYATVRGSGRRLGSRELAIFLALHFCALHSKEMAVTLPAVVLAYEFLCQKQKQITGAILSGALNLPFLYGVFLHPNSFADNPWYSPRLSPERVYAFWRGAFSDLFLSWHFFDLGRVLAVGAVLTLLAWWPRRDILRFCWCFFAIAPLPLVLLVGRTGACLAIPYYALAIFAATLFTDNASRLASPARAQRARVAIYACLLVAGAGLWAFENAHIKRKLVRDQMRDLGEPTWSVIRQLRDLKPQVKPNSTVVFLNDPFEDFDMAFIAELWFRKPGLMVRLNRKTPLSQEELAKAEHVFAYEQGRLSQVR
jgi:hypothetical protein